MGIDLLGSLGLDTIPADPNAIPDGTYDGEVMKSELVLVTSKNTVNHVITYKVTEGERKGAQKPEWYELGVNPVTAENTPASKLAEAASFTPSMKDERKPWYNKRAKDLGVEGERFTSDNLASIVGVPVTFNLKTENGFQNLKWVNPRKTQATTVAPEQFATAPASATAAVPSGDPGF
jgi:hypothetical protein